MTKYVQLNDGRCGILVRRDSRHEYEYIVDIKGDKTATGASMVTFISKEDYEAWQPKQEEQPTKPKRGAKKS